MNNQFKPLGLTFLLFFFLTDSFCQNDSTGNHYNKHFLGLMVGYAWVPHSTEEDGKAEFIIPSIGIDYTYKFSHRFGLKFVNDVELTSYYIKDKQGELLKREFKYIGAITADIELFKWMSLYTGPGFEIEVHKSFFIYKIGTEITKEFCEGWKAGINTSMDINNTYQTYSCGLILTKAL